MCDDLCWKWIPSYVFSIVNELSKRVRQCAQAGAIASETEFQETLLTGVYETLPNLALANCIQRNLESIGGHKYNNEEKDFAKKLGFEDPLFEEILPLNLEHTRPSNERGNVSWLAPLGGFYAACHAPGTPGHHWLATQQYGMEIGEKGMETASKTMATSALELICNPDVLSEVQKEFKEKTKGFVYDPLVPQGQKPNPLGIR